MKMVELMGLKFEVYVIIGNDWLKICLVIYIILVMYGGFLLSFCGILGKFL